MTQKKSLRFFIHTYKTEERYCRKFHLFFYVAFTSFIPMEMVAKLCHSTIYIPQYHSTKSSAIVFENHSIVHLTTQGKVIFKSIIWQWAAWKDSCSPIFSLNESWIQNTEGVLNHIKWFLWDNTRKNCIVVQTLQYIYLHSTTPFAHFQ